MFREKAYKVYKWVIWSEKDRIGCYSSIQFQDLKRENQIAYQLNRYDQIDNVLGSIRSV